MLFCNQCSSEVSVATALLTQNFYAETLIFCSASCQDLWIDRALTPSTERHAAAVGSDGLSSSLCGTVMSCDSPSVLETIEPNWKFEMDFTRIMKISLLVFAVFMAVVLFGRSLYRSHPHLSIYSLPPERYQLYV